MIQRIQTVWLFIAALFMAAMFYFPVYELPKGAVTVGDNYLAIILVGISIILSFIAIFSFKKRKSQIRISTINIIIVILLLIWLFYSISVDKSLTAPGEGNGNYWIGSFLPLCSIVFFILAIRAIRKDDKLVKSMDRLR